jgi:hypothetical protein
MKGAPFRAIGGAVISDHGPIPLAQARELARVYASEARRWRAQGHPAFAACTHRAAVLRDAVASAETWRRAAGWTNPDAADAWLTRVDPAGA